jgi:hypothetical protein
MQTYNEIHKMKITPTGDRIDVKSESAIYPIQPLPSLLARINNSGRLQFTSLSEECAGRDASSPFLCLVAMLRRGGSRCDGRQRHRGRGGRFLWLIRSVLTRGTPRSRLRLGTRETLNRVSSQRTNTYRGHQDFHKTFSLSLLLTNHPLSQQMQQVAA